MRESNLYVSLESSETLLPQTIDYLGAQHFMYASDVPHWDNEFPESLQQLWEHPQLSDDTKRKILHDNAATLYAL